MSCTMLPRATYWGLQRYRKFRQMRSNLKAATQRICLIRRICAASSHSAVSSYSINVPAENGEADCGALFATTGQSAIGPVPGLKLCPIEWRLPGNELAARNVVNWVVSGLTAFISSMGLADSLLLVNAPSWLNVRKWVENRRSHLKASNSNFGRKRT